jgi:hypothetical protein
MVLFDDSCEAGIVGRSISFNVPSSADYQCHLCWSTGKQNHEVRLALENCHMGAKIERMFRKANYLVPPFGRTWLCDL